MVDFETPISIIDVSIDFIVDTTTLSDNSKSGVRGRVVIIYWSYSSGFDMVGLVDMSWVKKYVYFFWIFFFNAIAWSWEDSFFLSAWKYGSGPFYTQILVLSATLLYNKKLSYPVLYTL